MEGCGLQKVLTSERYGRGGKRATRVFAMREDKEDMLDNEHKFFSPDQQWRGEVARVSERTPLRCGRRRSFVKLRYLALLGNGWRTCGLDTVQSSSWAAER